MSGYSPVAAKKNAVSKVTGDAWITGTGTLIHPIAGQCAYPTP